MRYLHFYSLLAFAITLGFLVTGVEDAKERQKLLLQELERVTKQLKRDTEPLPEMLVYRKKRLGMDLSIAPMPQFHADAHTRLLLDSTGAYGRYLTTRHRYEFLTRQLNKLPIPNRGWKFIAAMEQPQETYMVNEVISDRFNIFRVSTSPSNIRLHVFVDSNPEPTPLSAFPLISDHRIGEIQIQYQNPVTGEEHSIHQKFN